jgi:hypothetical protein
MLLAAFSRWRVERCFEDQKGEVGLDHYEGRRNRRLKRRLVLSMVSYLFLTRMRQDGGGGNPELTECQAPTVLAALIPSGWLGQRVSARLVERTATLIERTQQRNATARRRHTKRTRRRPRALGIKLTELKRCQWGRT